MLIWIKRKTCTVVYVCPRLCEVVALMFGEKGDAFYISESIIWATPILYASINGGQPVLKPETFERLPLQG